MIPAHLTSHPSPTLGNSFVDLVCKVCGGHDSPSALKLRLHDAGMARLTHMGQLYPSEFRETLTSHPPLKTRIEGAALANKERTVSEFCHFNHTNLSNKARNGKFCCINISADRIPRRHHCRRGSWRREARLHRQRPRPQRRRRAKNTSRASS